MQSNEITQKIKALKEISEKIEQKVDDLKDLKEDNHEIKIFLKEIGRFLQENLGILTIYKDIIKSNKKTNFILIILIIILLATLMHNAKEFTAYRENSIDKKEIIEILKDSTYDGE